MLNQIKVRVITDVLHYSPDVLKCLRLEILRPGQ